MLCKIKFEKDKVETLKRYISRNVILMKNG